MFELHVKGPIKGNHLFFCFDAMGCLFPLADYSVAENPDFLFEVFALLFHHQVVLRLLPLQPASYHRQFASIFLLGLFDFLDFFLLFLPVFLQLLFYLGSKNMLPAICLFDS